MADAPGRTPQPDAAGAESDRRPGGAGRRQHPQRGAGGGGAGAGGGTTDRSARAAAGPSGGVPQIGPAAACGIGFE